MLILALDTTTRTGSLSLECDGRLLETFVGDGGRTHATRLPGDILDCLARHHRTLADIDLYGVAAGPGSFTGLRIGIATIQGMAFAHGRPVVGVSALDALAEAAIAVDAEGGALNEAGAGPTIAAWMDAQRGEVYASVFRRDDGVLLPLGPASVQTPESTLAEWHARGAAGSVTFVGDGAVAYSDLITARTVGARIVRPVPPLAPAIARISRIDAEAGRAGSPHAIRPIYIRRPDAELARDRRSGLGG